MFVTTSTQLLVDFSLLSHSHYCIIKQCHAINNRTIGFKLNEDNANHSLSFVNVITFRFPPKFPLYMILHKKDIPYSMSTRKHHITKKLKNMKKSVLQFLTIYDKNYWTDEDSEFDDLMENVYNA